MMRLSRPLENKKNWQEIKRVSRFSSLRTIIGFRTVSDNAAHVIAEQIPIQFIAKIKTKFEKRRKRASFFYLLEASTRRGEFFEIKTKISPVH